LNVLVAAGENPREINPFSGLKPGVFPGLILSGAYNPDLKTGVLRRERIKKGGLPNPGIRPCVRI
jgi:hypothetical protein